MKARRWTVGSRVARCGLAMVVALIGCATLGKSEGGKAGENVSKVISPGHRTVLSSDEVMLICRSSDARLSIDSTAGQWEPFSPPLRVSQLKLSPGQHTIQAGQQTLDVFVTSGKDALKPPEGWVVHSSHPMPGETGHARCGICHETEQDDDKRAVVGAIKSHEACFECHPAVDFEVGHAHILEPLEVCQMCHALHGSRHPSLLRAPMRQLCAKCHDPDH